MDAINAPIARRIRFDPQLRPTRNAPTAPYLARVRAMTDEQLGELRGRAMAFLVSFDVAAEAQHKARRLLRWVLAEQRVRSTVATLPEREDLLRIHRRSDAELLHEAQRALQRFRAAYHRPEELSVSARLEAAQQLTWLKREWTSRYPSEELLEVIQQRSERPTVS